MNTCGKLCIYILGILSLGLICSCSEESANGINSAVRSQVSWRVVELAPGKTSKLFITDMCKLGDEIVIAGISGDGKNSIIKYNEVTSEWILDSEIKYQGLGDYVAGVDNVDDQYMVAWGGVRNEAGEPL